MPARRRLHAACAWAPAQELSEIQGRSGSERKNSYRRDPKDFAGTEASGKSEIARLQHRLRTTTADLNKLVKEEIEK